METWKQDTRKRQGRKEERGKRKGFEKLHTEVATVPSFDPGFTGMASGRGEWSRSRSAGVHPTITTAATQC